jgi:hypothetical protein
MGVIPCVTDVGRRLGVGDAPQAQSAHAAVAPPGSDAQQAAALVRLAGNVHGVGPPDHQPQVVQPAPETLFYTVKGGYTLENRARARRRCHPIPSDLRGEPPLLGEPDEMYQGQTLRIP